MVKIYLINQFDRWCPENNNGDYFIAAFSTLELAEKFVNKNDPRNEKGRGTNSDGLSIREFIIDEYIDKKHYMFHEDE